MLNCAKKIISLKLENTKQINGKISVLFEKSATWISLIVHLQCEIDKKGCIILRA